MGLVSLVLWYPAKNEEIHVILHTLVCGLQVDHMWITSVLLCESMSQMDQQVWPTFNPGSKGCCEEYNRYIKIVILLYYIYYT